MNFYIYYRPFHPKTNPSRQLMFEQKGGWIDTVRTEYKRLQGIYPGCRLNCVAENDWGERSRIHTGYWE